MDSRDAPGSSRFGGGTSEAAVSIIVARMEPFAAQSGGTWTQPELRYALGFRLGQASSGLRPNTVAQH